MILFSEIEDNSIQIKKDMEKFLYHLRIPAQVKVVEMVIKICAIEVLTVDMQRQHTVHRKAILNIHDEHASTDAKCANKIMAL